MRPSCSLDGSIHLTLGLMPPSWWGGTVERIRAFLLELREATDPARGQ